MWKLSYSYYWSLELYSGCEKPVYVVSSGDAVELFVNGNPKVSADRIIGSCLL